MTRGALALHSSELQHATSPFKTHISFLTPPKIAEEDPEMSTIASPRASSSIRSPSSTRNSFDSSTRPPPNARRNRAALRDYYGIKNAQKEAEAKISEESTRTGLGPEEDETLTELDGANFNAEAYVDGLLAKEGLKGVLKVEADLISRMIYLHTEHGILLIEDRNTES